jgi:transcriptional regulator with PAS, ATPase and Fis domain
MKKVDVRIIAATNRNLKEMVAKSLFREDFYYRLAVHIVDLPPLRERREDIPLLVAHFVEKYSPGPSPSRKLFTSEALDALQRYPWPGNVRELENEVRRLLAMTAEKATIELEDLPEFIRDARETPADQAGARSLREVVERFERDRIAEVLETCQGNKAAAARKLGMSVRNLFKKIEKYGL